MANNKPNAYSMYVSEVARKRKQQGKYPVNITSLYRELGDEWKNLPDEVKQYYKDMAKAKAEGRLQQFISQAKGIFAKPEATTSSESVTQQISSGEREAFSNEHEPLENRPFSNEQKPNIGHGVKRPYENDEDSSTQAEKKMKSNIPNHKNKITGGGPREYMDAHLHELSEKCCSIVGAKGEELISTPLHSFSANVMCKHKENNEDVYVPLEIGIYAYSLKEGKLGKPYSVLIDAGKVPTNCLNDALDHSKIHKIPFPPNPKGYSALARSDYKKIYKELLSYTKESERTILVANNREIPQVKGCLEWIYKKATEDGTKLFRPNSWTILPLVEYVTALANYVEQELFHQTDKIPALHYSLLLNLETSAFDYETEHMCKFHRSDDNSTKWCALSCATRAVLSIEERLGRVQEKFVKFKSSEPKFVTLFPHELPQLVAAEASSAAPLEGGEEIRQQLPLPMEVQQIGPPTTPLAIEAVPRQQTDVFGSS